MTIEKALELLNGYDSVFLPRTQFNNTVKALIQAVEMPSCDDDDICSFEVEKHSANEYTLAVKYCNDPAPAPVAADFTIWEEPQ